MEMIARIGERGRRALNPRVKDVPSADRRASFPLCLECPDGPPDGRLPIGGGRDACGEWRPIVRHRDDCCAIISFTRRPMTEWFKYPISTENLPKDQAYPITPKVIATVLEQNQMARVKSVAFLPKKRKGQFIKAEYQGENTKNTPLSDERHPFAGTITIWIFGVSKEEKARAEARVRKEVLPSLLEWITDLEQRGENWRQSDHNVMFKYEQGEVKISFDDNSFWGWRP